LGQALALAGILALAGVVGALAGALALAGVDAGAVVGGLRSRQRAGREHRSRGDDKRFPHTTTPSKVTHAAPKRRGTHTDRSQPWVEGSGCAPTLQRNVLMRRTYSRDEPAK